MAEREAHVKRVFAITGDQIDSDVWIDVLRIDKLPVAFGSTEFGRIGQIVSYVIKWNDDPNNPLDGIDGSTADAQYENANAARETHQIDIVNPDSPDDDHPMLWIVDRLSVFKQPEETGKIRQIIKLVFHNGNKPLADREATVVNVVNNDLGGMTMADDDGSNPRMVDWQDYLKALQSGTADDSQRLDVEITDKFAYHFGPEEVGKVGQIVRFVLVGNQLFEKQFDRGDPGAVDINGTPSVIRTDPLQSIVNVGFAAGLAVEFGDKAGPPKPSK